MLVPALVLACALAAAAGPGGDVPDVADIPEVLVTRQLAEVRGLRVGDTVALSARPRGAAQRFRVAGVYEPVPDPMRLTSRRLEARLHLPDLLALTADPHDPQARETVDAISVALRDARSGERFAVAVASRAPGLLARPTAGGEGAAPFVVLERFHTAIAAVTVLGSTAFLLALMVMRVDERREVVGILRLIGVGRRRILAGVLVEGLLLALAGAVFGVLFAAGTQGLVNAFFQWKYDTSLVFVRVTPSLAARCVAVAVPLGVLAGIVASWATLRRDTTTLVRR